MLYKSGETSDGKYVIGGVFKFYETNGLPLDIIFEFLRERNSIPDWILFYKEAIAAGMSHDRVLSKLDETVSDSYGTEYKNIIIENLKNIYDKDYYSVRIFKMRSYYYFIRK